MRVAVVFEHTGVDYLRVADTVKFVKIFLIESLRYLNGAVSAEVIEYYAVAVLYSSDRLAVLGYDEGGRS